MMRWFGETWGDAAACRARGRWTETPVGRRCLSCEELIVLGDRGEEIPYTADGKPGRGWIHAECLVRESVGGPGHLTGHCVHSGGVEDCDLGMSARNAAVWVWNYVTAKGTVPS